MELGVFSFYRDITLVFAYKHSVEFDKNANSRCVYMCAYLHPFHIKLVSQLSEFAFFVRLLRWAHFLFSGGQFNTKLLKSIKKGETRK